MQSSVFEQSDKHPLILPFYEKVRIQCLDFFRSLTDTNLGGRKIHVKEFLNFFDRPPLRP